MALTICQCAEMHHVKWFSDGNARTATQKYETYFPTENHCDDHKVFINVSLLGRHHSCSAMILKKI